MKRIFLIALSISLALAVSISPGAQPPVSAGPVGPLSTQIDIVGPSGSESFGRWVTVLSNGNIVVNDPYYDAGSSESMADVGAVYLYSGTSGALISTLTGSTVDDQVGYVVVALINGNYVVGSPLWDDGAVTNAGAVTWCSGTTGCTGVVSSTNSLVGSSTYDWIGLEDSVVPLGNGNYVVSSSYWDDGAVTDAGAVTWCSGATGCTGVVSSTNSLVGSSSGDHIGGATELANGNYVVSSSYWDDGAVTDAGAVTWCSGTTGCTGVISSANSLVGSSADDHVGSVAALSNGNYVVSSFYWDNGAVADVGAATWCSGTTGCTGVVSSTNSLAGSSADDRVGYVRELANGNYVVRSPNWDNGTVAGAGAATWCSGTAGCTDVISSTNSLVGSSADDQVGWFVTALTNGNYVVSSFYWDNGAVADVGAVTWGDGAMGTSGVISSTNSLVGSTSGDQVGYVTALTNGHYVVSSGAWDSGTVADAGAATWCSGTAGCTGVISSTNSLVGSSADDWVGSVSVTALANGNYVVRSPNWDNGPVADAGAATWCSGTTGCTSVVSSTNSLVGSSADDRVGSVSVTALANGNYVVRSPNWDNGTVAGAGAATWCSGTAGCTGVVSSTNSLVGSSADDRVGSVSVTALANGNYVVSSPDWDNGAVADTGAVTWGNGTMSTSGVVSSTNSLVGSLANDQVGDSVTTLDNGSYVVHSPLWNGTGAITWCISPMGCTGPITVENSVLGTAGGAGDSMTFAYDPVNLQLVVGRPADNTVTLFRPYQRVFLPLILR
jgi:hypothetical protein